MRESRNRNGKYPARKLNECQDRCQKLIAATKIKWGKFTIGNVANKGLKMGACFGYPSIVRFDARYLVIE